MLAFRDFVHHSTAAFRFILAALRAGVWIGGLHPPYEGGSSSRHGRFGNGIRGLRLAFLRVGSARNILPREASAVFAVPRAAVSDVAGLLVGRRFSARDSAKSRFAERLMFPRRPSIVRVGSHSRIAVYVR